MAHWRHKPASALESLLTIVGFALAAWLCVLLMAWALAAIWF